MHTQLIVSLILLAASAVAFILYGVDKQKAKRHRWRIPESVLLCWGFLGGAMGALLGMLCFRHKTRHWYFYVVNILGLVWQCALLWYFG